MQLASLVIHNRETRSKIRRGFSNSGDMHEEVQALLAERGVISASAFPHLRNRLRHYAANGQLVRVLGDVYAAKEAASVFAVRLAAARFAYPNCVLLGETAAKVTWWTELETDRVHAAAARREAAKGFNFERRSIPDELVEWTGAHYVSVPALTVLDLTDTLGGFAIDDALRRGVVTLEDLNAALALTKGRPTSSTSPFQSWDLPRRFTGSSGIGPGTS